MTHSATTQSAVFGGGCFWCTEALFRRVRGVSLVESGYAGGETDAPDYDAVCSGRTGHAEVVRVHFDPAVVSYADLLRIHLSTHDATTRNRQGADVGTQYRSIILVASAAQRADAEAVLREMAAQVSAPIVTQVAPLTRFFAAEGYHQDYYARNAGKPYCMAVIDPKLAKLRASFADKLLRG